MQRRPSSSVSWPAGHDQSIEDINAEALRISNEIAERTVIRKTAQSPEITREGHGTIRDRMARLKTEQGTMLRAKHVPSHLRDRLLNKELKDTSRGKNVGFEFNFREAGKKMEMPLAEKGHTAPHHESNTMYDQVYEAEIKKPKQDPEIVTGSWAGQTMRRKHNEPFTFEERMARLKTEQGTLLRLKHAPERHHQILKNKSFKDTTRGHDVGFEYNFRSNGAPLPKALGKPSDALAISSEEYDGIYAQTKMRSKSPEIEEQHFGGIMNRQASIKMQQGTNLRKSKHLPPRLRDQSPRDHPSVRTVGFEYNVTGQPGRKD